MTNSPQFFIIAEDLRVEIPPKGTIDWDSGSALADILAEGHVGLSLHVRLEDGICVVSLVQVNEEAAQAQGTVARGRILSTTRCPIPQLELTAKRTAGIAGDVIPRGRLRALIQSVTNQEQMDDLCWCVLRRYAAHHRCLPNPPHNIRRNAHSAIKRARKCLPPEPCIPLSPEGFWSRNVPETSGVQWPTTVPLEIQLGNKVIEVYGWRPLDELLDPLTCPSQSDGTLQASYPDYPYISKQATFEV